MLELIEWIVFLPFFAAALMFLAPKSQAKYAWSVGTILSLLHLALVASAWFKFDLAQTGLQLVVSKPWWPELGSRYLLGLDGVSLVLCLLVSIVGVLVLLGGRSFTWFEPEKEKFFVGLLFLIQGGALGTFAAADSVVFYIFWEAALLPAVLLIGIFGGKERIKASVRFFVYTVVGSLFMLLAFAWLVSEHTKQFGVPSAVFSDLARLKLNLQTGSFWTILRSPQGAVCLALCLAFLMKSPLFLLHGWLPKTYREAPTAATAFIAAVMSKMGTYGILRFMGWFPEAMSVFSSTFMWLSVVGIIYGAFQAITAKSHKELIAWSSLSHVSYILLGLFSDSPEARSGAVLQMFNHGVIIAGLFLISGYLESRRGSLTLADFGGYVKKTPVLSVFFMILVLASVALPGTNGFVGEFLILAGAFKTSWLKGTLAALGMVFGAMYMLSFFQKTMFGKGSSHVAVKDLFLGDILAMAVASWFVFSVGLYPNSFMSKIQVSIPTGSQKSNATAALYKVKSADAISSKNEIASAISSENEIPSAISSENEIPSAISSEIEIGNFDNQSAGKIFQAERSYPSYDRFESFQNYAELKKNKAGEGTRLAFVSLASQESL